MSCLQSMSIVLDSDEWGAHAQQTSRAAISSGINVRQYTQQCSLCRMLSPIYADCNLGIGKFIVLEPL